MIVDSRAALLPDIDYGYLQERQYVFDMNTTEIDSVYQYVLRTRSKADQRYYYSSNSVFLNEGHLFSLENKLSELHLMVDPEYTVPVSTIDLDKTKPRQARFGLFPIEDLIEAGKIDSRVKLLIESILVAELQSNLTEFKGFQALLAYNKKRSYVQNIDRDTKKSEIAQKMVWIQYESTRQYFQLATRNPLPSSDQQLVYDAWDKTSQTIEGMNLTLSNPA